VTPSAGLDFKGIHLAAHLTESATLCWIYFPPISENHGYRQKTTTTKNLSFAVLFLETGIQESNPGVIESNICKAGNESGNNAAATMW